MKYSDFKVGDFITNKPQDCVWLVDKSSSPKRHSDRWSRDYSSVCMVYDGFKLAKPSQIKKFQAAHKLRTIGVVFSHRVGGMSNRTTCWGTQVTHRISDKGEVGQYIKLETCSHPEGNWAKIVEVGNEITTKTGIGEISDTCPIEVADNYTPVRQQDWTKVETPVYTPTKRDIVDKNKSFVAFYGSRSENFANKGKKMPRFKVDDIIHTPKCQKTYRKIKAIEDNNYIYYILDKTGKITTECISRDSISKTDAEFEFYEEPKIAKLKENSPKFKVGDLTHEAGMDTYRKIIKIDNGRYYYDVYTQLSDKFQRMMDYDIEGYEKGEEIYTPKNSAKFKVGQYIRAIGSNTFYRLITGIENGEYLYHTYNMDTNKFWVESSEPIENFDKTHEIYEKPIDTAEKTAKFKVGDILRHKQNTHEITIRKIDQGKYHYLCAMPHIIAFERIENNYIKIGDKDHKYRVGDIVRWSSSDYGTIKDYEITEITDSGYKYSYKGNVYDTNTKYFEDVTQKPVDKSISTVKIEEKPADFGNMNRNQMREHLGLPKLKAVDAVDAFQELSKVAKSFEKPKSRIVKFLFG